jgi:hypothetical protein
MQRRRLNASRNAGLLATVPAPRVNHERELIARPGPVGDETLTQRDQLSLAIVPQPGDRNLGGRAMLKRGAISSTRNANSKNSARISALVRAYRPHIERRFLQHPCFIIAFSMGLPNTWCRTRARCSAASKFRVAVPKRIRVASASGACMLVTSITASTPTSALSTPSTVDTSTPRARATQWSRDPPSATSSPYSDRQHRCRRSSATRIGILRINEKESAVG